MDLGRVKGSLVLNKALPPLKGKSLKVIEEIDARHINDSRTNVYYILTKKGNNIYEYLRNTKNHINHVLFLLS